MAPRFIVRIGARAFQGTRVACLGNDVASVLKAAGEVRHDLVWYAADVAALGPSMVSECRPQPELIGQTSSVVQACLRVSQFTSGVFAGVPAGIPEPRFRAGGLWTEDSEDADIGDALVEVRAFDTTYIRSTGSESS